MFKVSGIFFEFKKFQFITLDKKKNVSIMAVDFDVAEIKILSPADHNEITLRVNLKLAVKPLMRWYYLMHYQILKREK